MASIRRHQVIEAAVSIIASQGIANLSLSAIEAQTGMSRGQLTYYFKTKDEILLAVFDWMVERMRREIAARHGQPGAQEPSIEGLLYHLLFEPIDPVFAELQYTFLASLGHRDDFRARLANLYAEWRGSLVKEIARRNPKLPAEVIALLFQSLVHGLIVQCLAAPDSFDRTAVYHHCCEGLRALLGTSPSTPHHPESNLPLSEGESDVESH